MNRVLGLALVLAAAAATAANAPQRFTDKQREARFYFDLGADTVDVAAYPKEQQANYKVFSEVCSKCHTLARPINAPLAARADWKRFIARMHVRTKVQNDKAFTKEEAKSIVDFLAYDSDVRKVKGKAAFDAETRRLQTLFVDVKTENARVQAERDAAMAKPYGDQPPVTPRP